jgi:V8-like Glu-specific endopeptidase
MGEVRIVPSFKETGLASGITEFALAILARRGNNFSPSGTAVAIAPNLAMTAKHVVEGHWRYFEDSPLVNRESKGSFSVQCFQVLEQGASGALWVATRFWLSPHTDIAYLGLRPASKTAQAHRWRGLRMNLLPPRIGERVSAFGYAASEVSFKQRGEVDELLWKDSPSTSIGEVIEIHPAFRDTGSLKFPCFRVNARFDPGMSGGPVFNESGLVCGIICSNLPPAEADGEHVSYCASLWPGMATVIDMNRQGFEPGVQYPVLDLAKDGFLKAEGWQSVGLIDRQGALIRTVGLRTTKR